MELCFNVRTFFQHCLPIQKFSYAVKNGLEAVTLSENLTQFTDASDISAWAVSAMQWAVGQGLIQGSNGQLRPQANASRAEVATILMHFCELMKK